MMTLRQFLHPSPTPRSSGQESLAVSSPKEGRTASSWPLAATAPPTLKAASEANPLSAVRFREAPPAGGDRANGLGIENWRTLDWRDSSGYRTSSTGAKSPPQTPRSPG